MIGSLKSQGLAHLRPLQLLLGIQTRLIINPFVGVLIYSVGIRFVRKIHLNSAQVDARLDASPLTTFADNFRCWMRSRISRRWAHYKGCDGCRPWVSANGHGGEWP